MIKKTETTNKYDFLSLAIFFPAVVALSLVPIITKVTAYLYDDMETYGLFGGTLNSELKSFLITDMNTIGKASAICVLAIIMLALALMCCWFMFRHAEKKMLVYTGASVVYVALSLMSALGSEYKDIAFNGVYGRMEGFFVTASYFVMFLFTMYAFRKTQNFSCVIIALMICTGVNIIIGFFQYTGNNLLLTDWYQAIAIDGNYKDLIEIDIDAASEKGKMYGALYHYNYVGSFMGMVIPLFTVLAAYGKTLWHKLVFAAFAALSLFMLFASTARSGLVAIAAAAVIGIVVFARVLIRRWKVTVSVVAGAAVLLVGANFALDNALFRRIPSLFTDIVEFIAPAENVDLYDTLPIREVIHNADGSVTFVTQTDALNIKYNEYTMEYEFTDNNGDELTLRYDAQGLISVANDGFKGINLEFATTDNNPYRHDAFFMWFDGDDDMPMIFTLHNEKQLHMIHPDTGERVTPVNAEAIGFKGKELLGSSRGYIWSRTIPMLKDCIVTGYGPDTFAYKFPQNDYLAKYYAYREGFYIVVDKPHNLYLQIFFSNGLIALVAFLAICVFYLVDCFRLYALRREYRMEQIYGISIMLAVVGYLAAGMFNDSVVAVAPVFWILLGVGAAMNTINRRYDKQYVVDGDGVVISRPKTEKELQEEQAVEDKAAELAKALGARRDADAAAEAMNGMSEETVAKPAKEITEQDARASENVTSSETNVAADAEDDGVDAIAELKRIAAEQNVGADGKKIERVVSQADAQELYKRVRQFKEKIEAEKGKGNSDDQS